MNRANPKKPNAVDKNGKEETIMKNIFSKKRKIEVTHSDCEAEVTPLELETHLRSAKTEDCPLKSSNNPEELVM